MLSFPSRHFQTSTTLETKFQTLQTNFVSFEIPGHNPIVSNPPLFWGPKGKNKFLKNFVYPIPLILGTRSPVHVALAPPPPFGGGQSVYQGRPIVYAEKCQIFLKFCLANPPYFGIQKSSLRVDARPLWGGAKCIYVKN